MTAGAYIIEIHRVEINCMLAHSKSFSNNSERSVTSVQCFLEPPYDQINDS